MKVLNEPKGRPTKVGPTTIRPLRSKCVVRGCGKDATSWWPLLRGGPAFCNKHYHKAPEYGADLSGPDDFDIPVE